VLRHDHVLDETPCYLLVLAFKFAILGMLLCVITVMTNLFFPFNP